MNKLTILTGLMKYSKGNAENGYSFWMNLFIAVDQLLNAILKGSCDETLSSRTYRMAQISKQAGKTTGLWIMFEKLVDKVFWLDVGKNGERHCQLSYLVEMERGHLPPTMYRDLLLEAK